MCHRTGCKVIYHQLTIKLKLILYLFVLGQIGPSWGKHRISFSMHCIVGSAQSTVAARVYIQGLQYMGYTSLTGYWTPLLLLIDDAVRRIRLERQGKKKMSHTTQSAQIHADTRYDTDRYTYSMYGLLALLVQLLTAACTQLAKET